MTSMLRWVVLAQGSGEEGTELLDELPALTAWDWVRAGIIFGSAILLSQILRKAIIALMERRGPDRVAARITGRLVAYVVVVGGFVYTLVALEVPIGPLVGALGVGGIALAFALQDTMENLIAGLVLEARSQFRRGDQICADDFEGTVEDINLRTVVLRTFDGVRVVLPNAEVLKKPIVNFTAFPQRRTTLVVGVAYATDLSEAQRVILDAVRGIEGVHDSPPPEAYVQGFMESSIDFAVRYWHEPSITTLWRVRDAVAQGVKRGLDEAGITIPFPQRTVWFPEGIETRTRRGDRAVPVPSERPDPGDGA